jgi:hypothetical protein
VTDEHHVARTVWIDRLGYLGDMGLEVDPSVEFRQPFTDAGERRRRDGVSGGGKEWNNAMPAKRAVPGAMHQNERRHRRYHFPFGRDTAPMLAIPAGEFVAVRFRL